MRDFKIIDRFTPSAGKSFRRYLMEVSKHKILDANQEFELFKKISEGDEVAREAIINSNLRFVISVAKAYSQDPDLFAELVAAGNLGLVSAIEKFDHTKGFKFISYAVWHIRKEILQFLSENSRTIKIPTNKFQMLKAVEETESSLTNELGRNPTMEEIITRLGEKDDPRFKHYDPISFESMLMADKKTKSLDSGVSADDDSVTWGEIVASTDDSPDLGIVKSSGAEYLLEFVNRLHHTEREIVLRYHGFAEFDKEENFPDIGKTFGLSGEATRQRYAKAIKKLRILARKSRIQRSDFSKD